MADSEHAYDFRLSHLLGQVQSSVQTSTTLENQIYHRGATKPQARHQNATRDTPSGLSHVPHNVVLCAKHLERLEAKV